MTDSNEIKFNNVLKAVVEECRKEKDIHNEIIRDEVLGIIEKSCYVVYYPLENEDINGFHVVRTIKGEKAHFVYINTANTTERQIFTAAHELGHIWGVYGKVKEKFAEIDEYATSLGESSAEEFVVNKFAAELLMPKDAFEREIGKFLKTIDYNGESISKMNLLRLVVHLMDTFFVGYKSTTLRLLEIDRVSRTVYEIMKAYENQDGFDEAFNHVLKEGNYKRLNKRSGNKNISKLTEILRKAEENGSVLESTIDFFRKDFGIMTSDIDEHSGEINF